MTKTISLADDAYRAMRRAKRPGESFSALARRTFGQERPAGLTGLAGIMRPDDAHWQRALDGIYAARDAAVDGPVAI